MRIRPLFKWFGSKWSATRAERYPAARHGRIVEPYAGSAGYSLNHCDLQVCIWDSDPLLTELWRWLIGEATAADVTNIPVGAPAGTDIRTMGLSRGQALLLKHWQRTNNVGDCWTVSPWGHLPGQWTANTRARVAEESQAIKHWRLERVPFECVGEATWFIDPPYQYNYQYRKTTEPVVYETLATDIASIHAQSLVIVCEAVGKHGEVPGYLPFVESHRQVTSRRKREHSHHSAELCFVRGAS